MSETSLVSVYITTRNRPDMLDRALASLTKQTFRNFEVLICNDNSEAKYLSYYTNVIEK
ncbi:TPA: glycosyltransferase family 2 protein, partial [Klebsiella pneumoniae]|nr:glycosyltransferase family 2 protein [Klebsiella pneumoniae]